MEPQPKHKTAIKTALGVSFIVFGLIGLIFPIIPGWWVILIGLQMLGIKLVIDRKKPWSQVIRFKNENEEEKN
uniref:DUF454 family protein n=1 Tax=candidate division WWE3 bacterium TaxID=2053526 RepID=A0A7C4XSV1_UNCKA